MFSLLFLLGAATAPIAKGDRARVLQASVVVNGIFEADYVASYTHARAFHRAGHLVWGDTWKGKEELP